MTLLRTIALLVLATALYPAQAAIYKCKNNGKLEYRDTPCYYQSKAGNSGNKAGKVDITPPKKSGSNIQLNGSWCQYGQAESRNAPRSVANPIQWRFRAGNTVKLASVLNPNAPSLYGQYSLASDYLKVNNTEIGNWFIEDYRNNTFTLASANGNVRYLKRGNCAIY